MGADKNTGLPLDPAFRMLYGEEPYAGNEQKHWQSIQKLQGATKNLGAANQNSTAHDALEAGAAVEADYAGKGNYYPGKINRVNEDDDPSKVTYDVLYDDGDRERGVPRSRLRVAGSGGGGSGGGGSSGAGGDMLEVGTAVEADYAGKGNYYPGKINRVNEDDDPSKVTYDVLYDDGDRERGVPRSRLRVAGSGGGGSGGGGSSGAGGDMLEVGAAVEADYAGKGNYYPGKINRVNEDDDPSKVTYDVLYDDGDRERGVPRSRLRVAGSGGGGSGGGGSSGAGGDMLEVGTAVEADYAGKGNYYPGKINRVNEDDDPSKVTYDVLYDDGDRERGVPRSRLRVAGSGGGGSSGAGGDMLEVGTAVEADYAGKGNYYPGKINRVNEDDDPSKVTYDVLYDDGDRERGVPRSRIRRT